MIAWDRGAKEIMPSGRCYGGLDLASTTDIAAWVLVFPKEDGSFHVLPRFFIPYEGMREKGTKDRVDYESWARQKFVIPTPGETIDYNWIFEQIDKDAKQFDIEEIAFDRWGSESIVSKLAERNMVVIPFAQTFSAMSAPTKELLNLTIKGNIIHASNPVLRWMADNVVTETDPAGNIRPSKRKSTHKIDGIVATIMALDRALRNRSSTSVYEERELIVI
jgi:phage terminase large subunit-like protein